MRRRVVVTGIGCITPMGTDVETVWSRLEERRVGRRLHHDLRRQQLPHQDLGRGPQLGHRRRPAKTPSVWKYRGRHTQVRRRRRQAGGRAIRACSTPSSTRRGSASIWAAAKGSRISTASREMMTAALDGDELDLAKFTKAGLEMLHPVAELEQEPNMPAGHLAGMFNAQGPNANCLTACAASSQAIGEATEIIRRGDADVMLSGGTHSMIHPFGVTGFNLLTALSHAATTSRPRPRRPFDRDRDGFVLGEGGGDGRPRRARARQAPRREDLRRSARLRLDGRRLPHHRHASRRPRRHRLHADGDRRRRAQRPTDIHYINAHGTSTAVNDKVEIAGHQDRSSASRPTRCPSPAPRA